MPRRWLQIERTVSRPVRVGAVALMFLTMTALLAVPSVSAYPAVDGPQLLVDAIVVPPGTPVRVTLNTFPAGDHIVLHVRPSLPEDQTAAPLAFPGMTDTLGSGSVLIPTTGFGPGNYIISVAEEGVSAEMDGVLTAFAVVDPGFMGPRIVRVVHIPGDEES